MTKFYLAYVMRELCENTFETSWDVGQNYLKIKKNSLALCAVFVFNTIRFATTDNR